MQNNNESNSLDNGISALFDGISADLFPSSYTSPAQQTQQPTSPAGMFDAQINSSIAPEPTSEVVDNVEDTLLDPTRIIARVDNADGSVSTVRTMSANFGDGEVLLPTVHPNGYIMSDDEAIDRYKSTGENFGTFGTIEDANKYANELHMKQALALEDEIMWDKNKPDMDKIKNLDNYTKAQMIEGIIGGATEVDLDSLTVKKVQYLADIYDDGIFDEDAVDQISKIMKGKDAVDKYKKLLDINEGNMLNSSFWHKPTSGSGWTIGSGLDAFATDRETMKAYGVPESMLQFADRNKVFGKKSVAIPKNNLKMSKEEFAALQVNIAKASQDNIMEYIEKYPNMSTTGIAYLAQIKHWAGTLGSINSANPRKENKVTRVIDSRSSNIPLKKPIMTALSNENTATDQGLVDALCVIRNTQVAEGDKRKKTARRNTINKYIANIAAENPDVIIPPEPTEALGDIEARRIMNRLEAGHTTTLADLQQRTNRRP